MAPAAPALPTRFPCWCRAIYSWGGESKRDLGFVEGDLIECLNAGDGSWWTGRLRRDRRMVGSFPSNFVQVLDESFRPGSSRGVSPIPGASVSRGSSTSATNGTLGLPSSKPEKTPSKSFRKPFQAYARAGSPNPATITRNPISQRGSVSPQRHMSRQTSTASSYKSTAEGHGSHSMRIRSPASSVTPLRHRSTHSSNHAADDNDSPPPPPPPHRVMYIPQSELNPVASEHNNVARNREFSGQASPAPNSPIVNGQTPSPLRDAMEDVMSSLHDMALHQEVNSQKRASVSPVPWSPDEIDQRYRPGWTRRGARPRSSLGIGGQDELDSDDDYQYDKVESTPGQRPNPLASRPHSSYGDVDEFQSRQNGVPTTLPHDFSDELFFSTKSNMENDKRSIRSRPTAPYYDSRSGFTLGRQGPGKGSVELNKSLKKRKSAYEMGREVLNRTFTTRSNMTSTSSAVQSTTTDLSTSTQLTSASMMSAQSADAFSATSAASLARRKGNITVTRSHPGSLMKTRESSHVDVTGDNPTASSRRQDPRPTGVIYHSGDSPTPGTPSTSQIDRGSEPAMDYFSVTVKPKKSGFFKKMIESAKTGAAGARSSIASGQPTPPHSPLRGFLPNGVTSIAGGPASKPQSGGGTVAGVDWVQVRRDVNRSNSLSQNERIERQERCHMMDHLAIKPVETLQDLAEGDEGADGRPVLEPTNYQVVNFSQVDKSTRFISGLPPMTNSMSLAQGYVCRPYRSDTQRLRAIFTYVSGKVAWEEDFEGEMDTRRVIQTGRGCAEEIAALVMEMCSAIGIHTEVVRGYLKSPGEIFEGSMVPHPNHWWNAVLIDGEWRILDCCLASPTNPKRSQYSSAGSQVVESWWYLVRPVEACYTHVPMKPQQQHICPPLSYEVLFALPCACPPYFKNDLRLVDFDTSMLRTEGLELVHIHLLVPPDIDCVAEVEAKAFETDGDGDYFESGEIIRKRALAQADWFNGEKRYTVKALLPGDEGQGVLKVYAGRKGLMHSNKDNPYPLALALPIVHSGVNPPYDLLIRHPTPHAQRHDLYVIQPQCARLAINNTFVFSVRQHPSSLPNTHSEADSASSVALSRPSSAMSMATSNLSIPGSSVSLNGGQSKPAKLAIQAPSGKIMRLMRKSEHTISTGGTGGGEGGDGGVWETIIKCGERGVWRCLVLADRSARWCVFAEWNCV